MKKFLMFALLAMVILIPAGVYAEGGEQNSVEVIFTADAIPGAVENDVVFDIYDTEGVLLDTQTFGYKRSTGWFNVKFEVPEYEAGKKFTVKLVSGGTGLVHCENQSCEQTVETYVYHDENGDAKYQTAFYMKFIPVWYKQAIINLATEEKTDYYHCVMDDDIYVTTDLLQKMGISVAPNGEGEKDGYTLTSYTSGPEMKFFTDDIYVLKGGVGENLKRPTFKVGELPYFPLSVVANYFECDYNLISDDMYECRVYINMSRYSEAAVKAEYINEKGITSRTEYLIWVSKKDFSVSLFKGSAGKWRWVKTMPCAIGAPSTPTIEGSFEYYQHQDRWQYDGYYCGPIMRFKGGYALHSVLLNNDGTFRDGRVGVRISHGCVRMLPDDINWLASNIPLYTRILVTA